MDQFQKTCKQLLENMPRRADSNEERKKKISRLKNIVSKHLKKLYDSKENKHQFDEIVK